LVCAVLFSLVWKAAFFPVSHAEALPDFAAMPVTWPSDLMSILELTYLPTHKYSARRATRQSANVVTITDENGVRREIRSGPKRENPVLRALDHVVHPFHRNANADHSPATATVSSQPSTN